LKFNLPKKLNKISFLVFNTMANLKNIIGIFLVLSVILLAGCSTSEQEDNTQDYNNDFVPDNNDIDNIPTEPITGNVVATVNDEEITSEDVAAVQQLLLQQGQQISEDDALEQVINQKVLEQKVQQENIVVTNEEAESVIKQQLAMQGATLDDYKQQIESMGVSYEAELESIKNQIAVQNYLEGQLEGQSFDVTEEEAQNFYEMYKAQSPEEVPSYEELQSQIIATLEQQKQQEAINILIQGLRTTANVEYK
jgi:multidrug efflux pump subunit AcrA (membrane-fusion protein)